MKLSENNRTLNSMSIHWLAGMILFPAICFCQAEPLPRVSFGKIERISRFHTELVEPRNIDIWLPDSYDTGKTYDVLYMHDGQMLFDSATTWNKQAWDADDCFGRLIKEGKIKECIIVGIWNVPGNRYADYFPEKIIPDIPEPTRTRILEKQLKGPPRADNYLRFIVTELKPYIDRHYSTRPEAGSTWMMGSSMGGLISVYALCEYPSVFGGVACLSIHSPLASYDLIDERTNEEVASKFRQYLGNKLPPANTRKIYFDYGNLTGDAYYKPYQAGIDEVMRQKGYRAPYWQTKYFEGESHNEISWARRLDIPALFLLRKETP